MRRAFFLDGEDIVQAGENETIRNRYKIIRIGVNSAVVEDTVAKNQQTLPLAEEANDEEMRAVDAAASRRAGYALLMVFLMAAIIALMLYQQLPRVAFESERDKEQLLIDRGEQYTRAIQLYYLANNRQYPTSIDDLEKREKRFPAPALRGSFHGQRRVADHSHQRRISYRFAGAEASHGTIARTVGRQHDQYHHE